MLPSDAELDILKLLWARSPQSAREIHDLIAPGTGWAISTTRTVLERMRTKALLTRSDLHGMAVFEPAQSKLETLGASLEHVLRHVMEVPGKLPVSALTGSALLSEKELAELEKLVNRPAVKK